jgi:beta-xylosidase
MPDHSLRLPFGFAVVSVLVLLAVGLFAAASAGASQIRLSSTADTATLVYDQNFPDPSVLVVGHVDYAYSTNSGRENVPVIESNDLKHWRSIGDAMSVLPPWVSGGYVWSPSVSPAPGGGYELFFSAYDQEEGVMCLGRATSTSPLGPFIDIDGKPFLCQVSAGGSIDPSVYRFEGADYLIWKRDGETGQPQTIVSERLNADDARLSGSTTTLVTADEGWEDGIVEGPAFNDVSGVLRLYFSANRWASADYVIGVTTCTSPLGPCATSAVQKVQISSSIATGSGGPTFFESSGHTYMAFAAWTNGVVGNQFGHRALFLMALQDPGTSVTSDAAAELAMKTGRGTRSESEPTRR